MKTSLLLLKLQLTLSYNSFIYFLQKIPLLGKLASDKLYKREDIGGGLLFLGGVQQVGKEIFGKVVYFALIYAFALGLFKLTGSLGLPLESEKEAFLLLLVVFSPAYGSLIKNIDVTETDQMDALCIKIYGMDPRTYYKASLSYTYLLGGTFYILVLAASLALLGENPLGALYFALFTLGCRLLVRFFLCRYIQGREDLNLSDFGGNLVLKGLLLPLGLLLVLVYLTRQTPVKPGPVFFGLPAGILGLALSLYGWRKLFKSDLLVRVSQRTLSYRMGTNENEKDMAKLAMNLDEKNLVLDLGDRIQQLTGIAFINEVFYHRLSKTFSKMVRIRVRILSLVCLALLAGIYFFRDKMGLSPAKAGEVNQTLFNILPGVLLYLSSLIYVSDQLTKLSFYHLDRTLMGDPLYRSPKMVLYSLRVRLKKALKLNLPILGILLGFSLLAKLLLPFLEWKLLAFVCFWEVLFMLFFSLYHLYVYYMIQPYDAKMKAKSPLYNILNAGIFLFSYESMTIFGNLKNPFPAYMGLAAVLLAFLGIGYFAVQALAPKNFKLRT